MARFGVKERGPEILFKIASENRTARCEIEADAEIVGAASDESCSCVGKRRHKRTVRGRSFVCG